ncbi:MAG: ABC transporter permease [Acidobacteria bacterium]|nr:ABC transporter permease [Acidobacteriota bacterium]
MNWEHLKTYIWVRWRLSANQVRRSGTVGVIIAAILTGMRLLGGIVTFIAGLLIGFLALSRAEPRVMMIAWDGVAVGFIFFWMIGLMSELQRSELLSLDNFMHLPVSPSGAFLINYAGSSISLSLILFLPAMIGLSVGLILSRGLAMLPLFLLVAAFFLMVTAVTYQFRGWLAGMMTNPRRRRTIIAVVSLVFILVFQIPNILTHYGPGARAERRASQEAAKEFAALDKELDDGRITQEEHDKQSAAKRDALNSDRKERLERGFDILQSVNMAAPPGWLPYGASAAVQGRKLPVLACFLGMGLIGIGSLRRSYKTTIRLYTGDFNKGRVRRKVKTKPIPENTIKTETGSVATAGFIEKKLPRISEHASAVALTGLRSLLRATEVKMMMLTPIILLVIFGGMLVSKDGSVYGYLRPLIALGLATFIVVISMTGFVGNQFAFDRSGFRVFVLSGVSRREILLGKNLTYLPLAVALMVLAVAVSQWMYPMRPDHLAAVLIQIVPIYLLFCLGGNIMSILAPITLKSGSGKPAPHQGFQTFCQMMFFLLVPIPIGLTFIPLGVEALLFSLGWTARFPVFLLLNLILAFFVFRFYRNALNWQGRLLHQNEQKILETVSAKGE